MRELLRKIAFSRNAAVRASRLVYSTLCLLIPVRRRQVVFMSFPDAADNSWYLYKYAISRVSGMRIVWLCEDPAENFKRIHSVVEGDSNNVYVYKKNSILGLINLLTSRVVFTNIGVPRYIGRARGRLIINLWHGMPIKKIGLMDSNLAPPSYSDYALSTSPLFTRTMAGCFGLDPRKVLEIGLPRNVSLTQNRSSTWVADVHAKFGTDPKNKLIFWLPTFRRTSVTDPSQGARVDSQSTDFFEDWSRDFLLELDGLAGELNIKILIKLHPLDKLNEETIYRKYDNLIIYNKDDWNRLGIDLYEALSISSGLITDVSSVAIDYMLTNNPIAFISKSIEWYNRGVIKEVYSELEDFFHVKDEIDLILFIRKVAAGSFACEPKANKLNTAISNNASEVLVEKFLLP